ncbi:hypothetical protein C8A00DRAFT_36462 [Chaetomidium leptoderma]|uniref:SigF-like NTF2-like domain-containing protein n=1 Tax=Chaetomidium leptoderma TaxID=669021 RepID=A0AAN6VG85_9PEZI|nr:hypothetical protein C8A00DRAFT_36462 [Chaetomidium leptoderma]
MEKPADEIKHVVRTLTQGTPDEQHDAIYRYFAPGATFSHPFCRVPSFKNLRLPGVGEFDSRALIVAIFRWYKILSPKIDLEVESCALDERTNTLYLHIFQIFSIWFIPFYRAPVRLVTVLHLSPAPPSSSRTTPVTPPPPPPYDAAKEKRHAVEEGAEPSYAAVTSGEASASTSSSPHEGGGGTTTTTTTAGESGGEGRPPTRYLITKQEDLYQVNEFLKFVSLSPGAATAGFLQLVATLFCLAGAVVFGPFMRAVWPAKVAGSGKEKQR